MKLNHCYIEIGKGYFASRCQINDGIISGTRKVRVLTKDETDKIDEVVEKIKKQKK